MKWGLCSVVRCPSKQKDSWNYSNCHEWWKAKEEMGLCHMLKRSAWNVQNGFSESYQTKQPKCPSTGGQINYCTFIWWNTSQQFKKKKSKLLIQCKTWINLKCNILSEGRQTWKATCYMMPFICHSGKSKTRERNQISGCQEL